ncbi:NADPH:quinone reductase [Rhodobacteraceae bacterium M382]|nr:NADPH:quinone reductase [Rhodobacteraceae bacterium M382]
MKAITYRRLGSAADVLQIEEIDCPAPASGEVTVDLVYSGANPSDFKARAGTRVGVSDLPWPYIIPHSDGSGVISAVGDGVSPGRIGERVWIWNGQWKRPMGTAAEQITLPSEQAVALPADVSLETGATLGIPGLTAAHAVFCAGPVGGKTVLVQGAAGSVGHLAAQLAKWGGAKVIATCSSKSRDRARTSGADVVLDYAAADLGDQILAANDGRPVDLIVEVELGANIDVDTQVIVENGTIAAYGSALNMTPTLPFYPLLFKAVTLDVILIYLLPQAQRAAAIAVLNEALLSGALRSEISVIYDRDDFVQAHETLEAGNRAGGVLLKVGGTG